MLASIVLLMVGVLRNQNNSLKFQKKITSEGKKLTLKELKENAASDETLRRTIIIDFGTGNFVFDAFSPDGFIIGGKYLRLPELPSELL